VSAVRTFVLFAAGVAGHTWSIVRRPVRFLPELAGLGLISRGAAMIYLPAGYVVAGLCLLLVGSRIPAARVDR
jgi:hypothetical protein